MKLFFSLLLPLFCGCFLAHGQSEKTLLKERKKCTVYRVSPNNQTLYAGLSYTGIVLIHPGVKAFVDYPYASKEKIRTKNRWFKNETYQKTILKTHQIRPFAGFYHHLQNHNAAYIGMEWSNIRHANGAYSNDWGVGLSYMRSFLNGSVYEQQSDGSFASVGSLAGYNHVTLNVYYSFLNLEFNKLRFALKGNQWIMYPHNSSLSFNTSIDFEFAYCFIKNPFK